MHVTYKGVFHSFVPRVSFDSTIFNYKHLSACWKLIRSFIINRYDIEGVGCVHNGFMKALSVQKATGLPKELLKPQLHDFAYHTLRPELRHIAKTNDKARFIITGHSLSGALPNLFVTVLSLHDESTVLEKLDALYKYG